jgi:hypothetical protein
MAKAILEFDLNEFDDEMAHKRAIKSLDLVLAIREIEECLRGKIKHGQLEDKAHKEVKSVQEEFYRILNDRNIDIEEILR